MTKFCYNCDTEAGTVALEDDNVIYLCYTCGVAYEWGQANPDALVVSLETYLESTNETNS